MKRAMFYDMEPTGKIRCRLCRFGCLISDGDRGLCHVRENRGGALYTLVYGKICAEQIDPIEKKPLFHVMPGSSTYSIATPGCNFRCRHCQNFKISQVEPGSPISGNARTPRDIVQKALDNGCSSISYTYTEPTVFFEFAYDTARLARAAGLKNIFVTNGYISSEALETLAPFLDAANIDLKGFSESFYRDIVHARLSEVLDSILAYRRLGIWIELTTLIIPGLNDSVAELQSLAEFIVANLGVDTPWHVSRFHPTYQLSDHPRTPEDILRKACEIGRAKGLRYVYEGNVPGMGGENTRCPSCSMLLVKRSGYTIQSNVIRNGSCPECGETIVGVEL